MNSQHSSSVVVTVLNFNRAHDTIECVQSLRACHFNPLEIVVIDNGSTDGSLELLRHELVDVEIISTGRNLGYTGGVNFSFGTARKKNPSYILVINNDTVVKPDFLNHLVDAMENNKDAVAAGGTIYYHYDKTKVWYAGGRLIRWRGLAVHNHKNQSLDPSLLNGVENVTFITGCLMLFRVSALNAIGIEDERFFMYLDDIEYSARIIARGYKMLYVPKAVIYHKIMSEEQNPFKVYFSVRNRLLFINVSLSGAVKYFAIFYYLSIISVKLLVWKITSPRLFIAASSGLKDYFAGEFYEGRGVARFLHI
jgi:GT2 family glycosyltransferase